MRSSFKSQKSDRKESQSGAHTSLWIAVLKRFWLELPRFSQKIKSSRFGGVDGMIPFPSRDLLRIKASTA